MQTIKNIFDEISSEPGAINKMSILNKYKDNELLKQVLYLALSKRIKFYLRVIPEYAPVIIKSTRDNNMDLQEAVIRLKNIYSREVTGHAATAHLKNILEDLTKDDAYIIECIINKDVRLGMGTTNINKIFPDLIEKTPYMGAKSFDEKEAKAILILGPAYSQIKMDGRYCNAIIRGGEVELESRSGETTYLIGAKFVNELINLPDCVLNGELTISGVDRYTSNGIISSLVSIMGKVELEDSISDEITKFYKRYPHYNSIQEALDSIQFTIWDIIEVDEYFDKRSDTPYYDRLNSLMDMLTKANTKNVTLIKSRITNSYEEAMEHFQEVLAEGEEGTILKAMTGKWTNGKPKWQIKMKLEMDVDLKITGFNYGSGKNAHVISSINAESSCGKVKTKPQGITEDMMNYLTENQDKLLGTIVECKSCGLSKDRSGNYALLHPVFIKLRDDKNTCDSLESIQSIEKMVKQLV